MPHSLREICASGLCCSTCRDPGAIAWRRSLAKAFILPPGAPDFECPQGLPWGGGGSYELRVASSELAKRNSELGAQHSALGAAPDYGPCEECRHERYRADGGHGCKLIDHGKPCMLTRLIRQDGPWPAECPRGGRAATADLRAMRRADSQRRPADPPDFSVPDGAEVAVARAVSAWPVLSD